jgi:hypothetical protein
MTKAMTMVLRTEVIKEEKDIKGGFVEDKVLVCLFARGKGGKERIEESNKS